MPLTPAQRSATAKYTAKAYDRIELKVLKGNKEIIQSYCNERGLSVNGLINSLLRERLAADGVEMITREPNEE
ncbi:MAG: hypothetical protein J1F63_06825 [Oscillospiraceae bacterium]|nr:hypothetical protein [Oscillospiraceae bacterium]